VELVSGQPLDDFPNKPGCRGQIGLYLTISHAARRVY